MATTRTIYVSKEPTSDKLKLRDSENHNPGNDDLTTFVDPGDTVKWVRDTDSGLSELVKVKKKSGTHQLLTGDPAKKNGVWQGTVKTPSPGRNKKEKYKIEYKVNGSDKNHSDDPVLQMKS